MKNFWSRVKSWSYSIGMLLFIIIMFYWILSALGNCPMPQCV